LQKRVDLSNQFDAIIKIMSKKIVVAEDDKLLMRLMVENLTEAGYELFIAYDGKEALNRVREIKPNLVMLDIMMPEMDGMRVLTELKLDDDIKAIPVIMMSNMTDDENIQRLKDIGAADYIVKGQFSNEEIVNKIKSVIGD
jgi:DNA-binding response OmpR family regulator